MLSAGQPIRPDALWLPATYTVPLPVSPQLPLPVPPQGRPPTALIE